VAGRLKSDAIIVSATKGLEQDTLLRMSEVVEHEVERRYPVVVLSGPSFAAELARELPTAVCVASTAQARSSACSGTSRPRISDCTEATTSWELKSAER
jgi:glycerol-3-phosphate dehydrogenase (NAD(P)+)